MILAHGVGGRSDLPLPVWIFCYGAGAALLISFVALRLLWPRPRLARAAGGRALPRSLSAAAGACGPVVRLVGVAAFALVLVAAAFGTSQSGDNLAPVAVFVLFWVGLQAASALAGDVWPVLSPWDSLAAVASRLRRRGKGGRSRRAVEPLAGATHWPAAAGIFAFVWLELCYFDPASPRALALGLAAYATAMLAGAARWGRVWLRTGDGFAAWFGLLAALAPFYRDEQERLRWRAPFAGLATIRPRPGTAALVLVVLGSTAFDGLSRTRLWGDVAAARSGWGLTATATLGLVWVIAVVALAYVAAMRLAARLTDRGPTELVEPFLHSLVPIALAYAVAHYFSLLVFEGQSSLALASDPLGRGWDLFGTAGRSIDYGVLSSAAIAYVQAGAIVVGHVVGVVVAHDRAVELFGPRQATRSQQPLLAAMVAFTVGGLALLLGT